jgi:hypothetical protein
MTNASCNLLLSLLLTYYPAASVSSLCQKTKYFHGFPQSQRKIPEQNPKLSHGRFLLYLSNSLFTNHEETLG